MEKYTKVVHKEEHTPVWLISLVILGVIGALAVLFVFFFGSSL